MLKQLCEKDLFGLLGRIAVACQLLVPRQLADGTRTLQPWNGHDISLAGEPLQRKPTACFFPQTEQLLRIDSQGQVRLPPEPDKPLALFGLDDRDLAGIAFSDRFFTAPPADDVYLRRRNGALLIALTGYAGPENQLLPLVNGNCDLELIAGKNSWLARPHKASAAGWLEDYRDGDLERLADFREETAEQSSKTEEKLQLAAQLLAQDLVPDSFWEEIAARCILCGGCNFACPTCTCFCLQDRQVDAGTERSRVWDSCQLDAFMREASGHNPLGTEALRTRRRIHHKLVADPQRWGELGCVACGRCDRTCPTGIGMFAVVEEIVRRYGNQG